MKPNAVGAYLSSLPIHVDFLFAQFMCKQTKCKCNVQTDNRECKIVVMMKVSMVVVMEDSQWWQRQ